MSEMVAKLDDWGRPAWIAAMVAGFIVFWPVGLAVLAFLLWSGRMGCGRRHWGDWEQKARAKWGRNMDRFAGGMPSSGNRAFDEYREETLKRLYDEQRSSRTSWRACAWRRTKRSSTSSCPSSATVHRRRPLRHHKAERSSVKADRLNWARVADCRPGPLAAGWRWPSLQR